MTVHKVNKKFKTREALLNWLKRGKVVKRINSPISIYSVLYYRIINNKIICSGPKGEEVHTYLNSISEVETEDSPWFRILGVYCKSTVKEAKGDRNANA